jgi:hypothetical protein
MKLAVPALRKPREIGRRDPEERRDRIVAFLALAMTGGAKTLIKPRAALVI